MTYSEMKTGEFGLDFKVCKNRVVGDLQIKNEISKKKMQNRTP